MLFLNFLIVAVVVAYTSMFRVLSELKWFLICQWGWRCRAKLAVRGSASDPMIGLYQEGTHNVVDIPECKGNEFIDYTFNYDF